MSEQARQDSTRRRIQVLSAIPVALGSFLIAVTNVGLAPAVGMVVVTPFIVVALISVLLRRDRNHRRAHLPDGVLASAGASTRVHQLRKFDPTMQLRGGPGAQFVGDAEVGVDSLVWRPDPRFRERGATDIVVRWSDVQEVNCRRLGGLFRCDACDISLHDGRTLTVCITSPAEIERVVASLGVSVTCDVVQSSSISTPYRSV